MVAIEVPEKQLKCVVIWKAMGVSLITHSPTSIQRMGNAAPNRPPSHLPPSQAQPAQLLFYSPAKTEVSPATLDGIRHPK